MPSTSNVVSTFPIQILNLLCPVKCFEAIRQIRWPNGVECVKCGSLEIKKNGKHNSQPERQKYECTCGCHFDDLTGTIFEGRHQPITVWILAIYFMGLNVSNSQIAKELDLNISDAHNMATAIRESVLDKKPDPVLKNSVEADEVYIVAGHKGHPDAVEALGREGRRNRLRGAPGRGTLAKEKPPVLGIVERGGDVALFMLPNVQIETIEPILRSRIELGSLVYTDEYAIYGRLPAWGYQHKTVCHAKGEYARDEDGDGHFEVHVNTIEGFWSLLRSWLRPHRGISQENLPHYLGFFEFTHNVRRRGKRLLPALLGLLLSP